MNPIKSYLRWLIRYALLTKKSSSTIWLGWADVSFGGKRAIQLGVPVNPTDALRYQHVTKVPTDHPLIVTYEKVYEDVVEHTGTNTDWVEIHAVDIPFLYLSVVRFEVTLRTAGATAEAYVVRRYRKTINIGADTEIFSTTSTTYVAFIVTFDVVRFNVDVSPVLSVYFRTTDPAYPWYSDRTTIHATQCRAMK